MMMMKTTIQGQDTMAWCVCFVFSVFFVFANEKKNISPSLTVAVWLEKQKKIWNFFRKFSTKKKSSSNENTCTKKPSTCYHSVIFLHIQIQRKKNQEYSGYKRQPEKFQQTKKKKNQNQTTKKEEEKKPLI